ncbi:MAG: PASTA domain-containing protein [Acidobacteria bacterium]|nr:MAG: PASTA domain-containing protein [Acidobacteriota bacterium]REK01298.1 MAG: PASTA domain-containing protein [Acidobacteriota bacterium]REK14254.1 MAG: PASTA domain-containing protein [Acidobacteriota bacterium]REK44969.1 MAG: PASTA domain-containing protein [Acidobacteriota bacterium]
MDFLRKGAVALGKLLIAGALAAAFFAGLFGVVYMQLTGTEVSIPKVVGKNFNDGEDELSDMGLRIKKIATRFSNEPPNTILEQRPRAGTIAKSGLIISVVVSEPNPPGTEPLPEVKDDEEAIEEIQDLPELETEKSRKRSKKNDSKEEPKTRDVIEDKPETKDPSDPNATGTDQKGDDDPGDRPAGDRKDSGTSKPANERPKTDTPKPGSDTAKPPPAGEVRPRKTPPSNLLR